MKPFKVFIDGQEGTTGLQIVDRLTAREDVQLLTIDPALRKDAAARKALLNAADVCFLCLPDAAAIEAVSLIENDKTIVIDASTAHRTNDAWAYGLPELSPAHREAIAASKRIANPGCYATGALALLYPLTAGGILPPDYPVSIHAVSGYSGAGKKGIAQYEAENRDENLKSPRQYGLSQAHKHLPEIRKHGLLAETPLFNPQICDFYAGMTVSIPLHTRLLRRKINKEAVEACYRAHYASASFIQVQDAPPDGFLPATLNTGSNRLSIFVCGNDERITLIAVLDNLGKGASGAAVQSMNIALALPETTGLV
ncbi:MAG: N-acetyl-gamma-glutamyl-phosphate reductase [Oscillospiraceae bacterium]|jgi:N-acetyl-gamma-glutamyl-phosphate reductase|nr:N-acetyl-gamma-glutamyl-phosphate reductase [Oscillospiraceae bacterium]